MGIKNFIERKVKNDTAVYWANPTNDGQGGFTYDTPKEIDCFWLDETNLIQKDNGREIISKASVYIAEDKDGNTIDRINENEMLYHGKLDDLTAAQKSDPKTISDAFKIIRFEKKPSLIRSDEYVKVAYLNLT